MAGAGVDLGSPTASPGGLLDRPGQQPGGRHHPSPAELSGIGVQGGAVWLLDHNSGQSVAARIDPAATRSWQGSRSVTPGAAGHQESAGSNPKRLARLEAGSKASRRRDRCLSEAAPRS